MSSGSRTARDTTNVGTTGFSIGLPIPLFNRNQGRIAIEKATRTQLFDEYMARLFEARSTIATTLADLRSIEEQIDAAEHFIPVARKLVETYRIALLEGHADVITYYNALNDLFAKQMDLLNLKKDLCNRMIALEIASGQFYLPGEAAIRQGVERNPMERRCHERSTTMKRPLTIGLAAGAALASRGDRLHGLQAPQPGRHRTAPAAAKAEEPVARVKTVVLKNGSIDKSYSRLRKRHPGPGCPDHPLRAF